MFIRDQMPKAEDLGVTFNIFDDGTDEEINHKLKIAYKKLDTNLHYTNYFQKNLRDQVFITVFSIIKQTKCHRNNYNNIICLNLLLLFSVTGKILFKPFEK